MNRSRKISVILLSISALLGLVRGMRMITNSEDEPIFFPYSQEMIKVSVFSNYYILGWIVFFLIGIFSIMAIMATVRNVRNYAYFIIVEAIFLSFLTLTHIVMTEFAVIHLFILAISVGILVLGVLQTPREF